MRVPLLADNTRKRDCVLELDDVPTTEIDAWIDLYRRN